jgi:capsular exopolysaccharide synthesis family protein
MRRPSLARLLIEKASPGLSNVLAGLCDVDEAIRKDVRPHLDVLFSGEIPPNPLELLGNPRMKKIIDDMSLRYDCILVDTPPVSIVSDACEVANVTDGVLFLVRQNETDKDAVIRGVKQLELSNSRLLGFVLNGIVEEGGKSYKYRYRYRYRYRYKYRSKYAYGAYGKKPKPYAATEQTETPEETPVNSTPKNSKGGK